MLQFYLDRIFFSFFFIHRDEMQDFKEEIERLKKLRGKGKRERKTKVEDGQK